MSDLTERDVFWETVASGPIDGPPMSMKDFRRWADIASERIASANSALEAQEARIAELEKALRDFVYQAPSALSCGYRCQLELEQEDEEAYLAAYANAEFVISKALTPPLK